MSIDRCSVCGNAVDTDKFPEVYRDDKDNKCICGDCYFCECGKCDDCKAAASDEAYDRLRDKEFED